MDNARKMTRRELGQSALAATGILAASPVAGKAQPGGGMLKRSLGKTGLEVSILGIGGAPMGGPAVSQSDVDRIVAAAADAGINYIDTAPLYHMSERRLGAALKGQRETFVLATKVEATAKRDVDWIVRESLLKLQTDYLDIVHLHNVGLTDRFPSMDALLARDGALQGLRDLKKKGVVRHIGLTCHLRRERVFPILDTGDIEVVMCAANFVDRHTYDFEGTVFVEAARRGLGIVAMKILGGPTGKGARLSAAEHYEDAVRYALSIPSLSVAIMGVVNAAEVEKAAATVRAYKPFSRSELARLTEKGKSMASEWGALRGPVSAA